MPDIHNPVSGFPELYKIRDPAAREAIAWIRRHLAQTAGDLGGVGPALDLYLPLSGGTLTGDLLIEKSEPEIRLIDATHNYHSRVVKTDRNAIRYAQMLKYINVGKAVVISGSPEYVTTISLGTDIGVWSDFTVMFFAKTGDAGGTGTMCGANTAGDGWFKLYQGTAYLHFNWLGGGTSVNNIMFLNTWVHIAVSFNATTETVVLYADGHVIATIDVSGQATKRWPTSDLFIGAHSQDGSPAAGTQWNGAIDEFRVYSSVLTASQIAQAASGCYQFPAGPLVGYHFDDDLVDWSNSNDGVETGSVSYDTGIVVAPSGSSAIEGEVWGAYDGVSVDEEGLIVFGNPGARTAIRGSVISLGGVIEMPYTFLSTNEIGAALVDADTFMVYDESEELIKNCLMSRIATYISGTHLPLTGGALAGSVADDGRGVSSIFTLTGNPAKSDGIASYIEGHIGAITTDGPTYAEGVWLNIDSGAVLGADVRALDLGIYESGATCAGRNAYGLAIHMEFDDTSPPAGIYPFRINCNDTAGHATPAALIFAPNKSAVALTDAAPGAADAYMKIKFQSGEVYRIMLVKE